MADEPPPISEALQECREERELISPDAWIESSPFYVRCIDPDCPTLRGADPPKRHYHYVGERRA